MDSIELNL